MANRVTLTIQNGTASGAEFSFSGPQSCLIGRSHACNLTVSSSEFDRTISRRHCLLGIEADCVWVRDLGSLNGTYLNGTKIGQRHSVRVPDDTDTVEMLEHSVSHGDLLQVGDLVFRVEVQECLWASDFEEESSTTEEHDAERSVSTRRR